MQKLIFGLLILFLTQSASAAEESDEKKKVPAYISLGNAMVLNLTNKKSRLTFLQLKADVLIADEDSKSVVESHIPAIRHQLILLLSEQSVQDMKSSSKREEIRMKATTQIQELLAKLAGTNDIEDVLFSSFLVQ